jgi:hypothetical protein
MNGAIKLDWSATGLRLGTCTIRQFMARTPLIGAWYCGFYGFYPYDPFPFDTVNYEVLYKTAFFEGGSCRGWKVSP